MNRLLALGVAATGVGIVGYAAGILVDYPGRAFSVTVLMIGITLIAIRRADGGTE